MTVNEDRPRRPTNCAEIQEQMVAYLKGGLPAGRQAAFQQHLLTCENCAREVQQARAFEAELRLEARRVRRNIPPISDEVSAQIQAKVYRRMRRALWFQRSLNVVQRAGALGVLAVVLVVALALFTPWRMQLATLGTAAPEETLVNEVEVEEARPVETIPQDVEQALPPVVPTATPLPAPSPTPAQDKVVGASRPDAGQPLPPPAAAITARETPLEAAVAIIDAAIAADDRQFALIMERAQPLPEASFRVWRRLERCQGIVAAGDLTYRVMVHKGRFASVYVFNVDERYLGDVKMWLARDGVWYLSTLNYSSFSALRHECRP